MANNLVIIFLALIVVIVRFRRDYVSGLAAALFFLVLLPIEVRIPLPGALPQVTIHRLLLVISAFFTFRLQSREPVPVNRIGFGLFMAISAFRVMSTIFAEDRVGGIKEMLTFVEGFLVYVVACYGIRDWASVRKVLYAVLFGLLIVAFIATVEKYRGINLASRIVPWKMNDPKAVDATFRHRILLGYAMAMGFPIAVGLVRFVQSKTEKFIVYGAMLMTPAACYFSNSRGPWSGLVGGGLVLLLTATPRIRKRLMYLGLLSIIVLMMKPGVLDSIGSRWRQTKSTDTLKGRSASYRMELWRVASHELGKSPIRMAFGYGGASLFHMQLSEQFEFGGGSGQLGYTSWDSEFAATLMKYGYPSFFLELLLYFILARKALAAWRWGSPAAKEIVAGCLATMAVYMWAMTNVAIFNPQLTFLFWSVAAIGVQAPDLADNESSEVVVSALPAEGDESSVVPTPVRG